VLDISQRRAGNTKAKRGNRYEMAGEMSRSGTFASCMKSFCNSLLLRSAKGSPVAFSLSIRLGRGLQSPGDFIDYVAEKFSARSIEAIAFERRRLFSYSIFRQFLSVKYRRSEIAESHAANALMQSPTTVLRDINKGNEAAAPLNGKVSEPLMRA